MVLNFIVPHTKFKHFHLKIAVPNTTLNMKHNKFSLQKRAKSFVYAFEGIATLIKEEHNARIHITATIAVLVAGWLFNISSLEWICILFCIGWVISLEAINSAIENIADLVSPEKNSFIKKAKDLGAASVLIAAIVSLTVGSIIFLPKITSYLSFFLEN